MKGWHFIRENKRLGYGDDNTVAAGYVYEVEPPIELCAWGLHASERAIDVLEYAPGPIVCRVELSGEIIRDYDKAVATRREVLWMADASDTLRYFARLCALDVIHLWGAPAVVREYLETGREDLRDAAWNAAQAAAQAATRDAARAATRATAWGAAPDAAWVAVWIAARDAQNTRLTKMLEEPG